MSELSLLNKFSLQAELIYSQQGLTERIKYRFDYLNVPILAKYYLTKNLSVEAGPKIGILLSAKEKISGIEITF